MTIRGGTAVTTGQATKTLPTTVTQNETERRITHLPRYKVLIHNDDVNSMDHVVRALRAVFKFEVEECVRIMLEAHETGTGLCTVEPLEQAELHRDQLRSASLSATIEPE